MELRIAVSLMMAFTLVGVGEPASAAGNGTTETIYQNAASNGSIELSNLGGGEQAEPVVVGEPAANASAPELAAPSASASERADKTVAAGTVAQYPIAWYGSTPPSEVKDAELANTLSKIGSTQLASGNPAASRRYLMMDRNTYMKLYGAN